MTKRLVLFGVMTALLLAVMAVPAAAAGKAKKGFDEFGYNYHARVFVGSADGVDRALDGQVWGDATYANDHLVMKWSKAWSAARYDGKPWTRKAWCTNHWSGMLPDGSRSTEQVKIVWVGPELKQSQYWRAGGYPIWDQFEVIMDHGQTSDDGHEWWALATPAGLGGK